MDALGSGWVANSTNKYTKLLIRKYRCDVDFGARGGQALSERIFAGSVKCEWRVWGYGCVWLRGGQLAL